MMKLAAKGSRVIGAKSYAGPVWWCWAPSSIETRLVEAVDVIRQQWGRERPGGGP